MKTSGDATRFESLIRDHPYGPRMFPTWIFEMQLDGLYANLSIGAPDADIVFSWDMPRDITNAVFHDGLVSAVECYLVALRNQNIHHYDPPEA